MVLLREGLINGDRRRFAACGIQETPLSNRSTSFYLAPAQVPKTALSVEKYIKKRMAMMFVFVSYVGGANRPGRRQGPV
jgi:hypothetical protein